jgi:hypothetical protein
MASTCGYHISSTSFPTLRSVVELQSVIRKPARPNFFNSGWVNALLFTPGQPIIVIKVRAVTKVERSLFFIHVSQLIQQYINPMD